LPATFFFSRIVYIENHFTSNLNSLKKLFVMSQHNQATRRYFLKKLGGSTLALAGLAADEPRLQRQLFRKADYLLEF
jgi:hypothetical protein